MNKMKTGRPSAFNLYIFLILFAFEILMSFTFLGYVHIYPLSVTFAYIPILIAACLLGPAESTVMGFVFGLASAYKSSAFYVMPADRLFSPFLSGNFLGSVMLAIGARTLFGLAAGMYYKAAKQAKRKDLAIGAVTLISPTVHAFIVIFMMGIFFPNEAKSEFFSPYLVISNAVSSLFCVLILELFWKLFNHSFIKKMKTAVNRASDIPNADESKKRILITVFTVFIFSMTLAAAVYFSQRTSYMLKTHNVSVYRAIKSDLMHLQIEFMAALFSLNIISVVVFIFGYQYSAYKNFLGELDALTGVMGRRLFLNCCERTQKRFDSGLFTTGWFLFFDIDYFKKINDTLGHTVGDNVLRDVALILKSTFYDYGLVGRMGGDEFTAMLDKKPLSETELKALLEEFETRVLTVLPVPQKVSLSIGACRFAFPTDMSLLMDRTDTFLYEAKRNGRAGYVLGTFDEVPEQKKL